MIVYLYAKCSTCKNALLFLKEHKVAFRMKEITTEAPSVVELQKMLQYQKGNIRKLFNTSGLLYKEMGLSQKLESMSVDAALILLSTHGMLVKRPFLLGDNFGLVGFKEAEWLQKMHVQQ